MDKNTILEYKTPRQRTKVTPEREEAIKNGTVQPLPEEMFLTESEYRRMCVAAYWERKKK